MLVAEDREQANVPGKDIFHSLSGQWSVIRGAGIKKIVESEKQRPCILMTKGRALHCYQYH